MTTTKKRVLSGMRPTGKLHLGHLHGVLDNWKKLQEEYECFFFVADWHALTTNYEKPGDINYNINEMLLDWLSVGIDPEKATIFVQSDIKQHAELHLLLSMITPVSWLERNPTYKEQQQNIEGKDLSTFGFLGYPVLQCADIIIYKANLVPVGVDQLPHVELTREITRRFNYLYGDTFPVPESMLTETPKLPGLDGRKMSKSYGNSIFISDTPEEIRKKMATMVTDTMRPKKEDPGDPENRCVAFNLHKLYIKKERLNEIVEDCKSAKLGCVKCKKELGDALCNFLSPIQEKRKELENPEKLAEILNKGRGKALIVAEKTLKEVRNGIGLRNIA